MPMEQCKIECELLTINLIIMTKSELKEIVQKATEEVWYNRRSLNPVEEQTELITEKLYEALILPVVGRSVWIVQDKRSLITHGLFSTKQKATNYINGSENMAIKKLNIDY